MKNKKSLLSLILALCLCMALAAPAWAADKIQDNQVRIIDIENELREYLAEYHPDIVFGSQEFIEYAVDVLMFDEDSKLTTLDNYDNIRFYLGEYISYLDENPIIIDNSATTLSKSTAIYELPNEYKKESISNLKSDIALEIQEEAEMYTNREQIAPLYNYDVSSAVAYAKKYCIDYNNAFNVYGRDCTNFVSQCVYTAGLPMIKPNPVPDGLFESYYYWYTHRKNMAISHEKTSTSWVGVKDFASFAVYSVYASMYYCSDMNDLQQKAQIGDIVQLRNDEGSWYHSIIITDGQQGNYKYCSHSNNRFNKPLADITETNTFRIIRF